jgi:hypothetical protein
MKASNHKELNKVDGKEKYRVEVATRLAALEDLDAEVEINSSWETLRESIKNLAKEVLGYYEWFAEG